MTAICEHLQVPGVVFLTAPNSLFGAEVGSIENVGAVIGFELPVCRMSGVRVVVWITEVHLQRRTSTPTTHTYGLRDTPRNHVQSTCFAEAGKSGDLPDSTSWESCRFCGDLAVLVGL